MVTKILSFTISITYNSPPIAYITGRQTLISGERATLFSENSYDPDGELVAYHWEQTGGPQDLVIENPALPNMTFETPVIFEETQYELQLTVTDKYAATASTKAIITVAPSITCENCTQEQKIRLTNSGRLYSKAPGGFVTGDGTEIFYADQRTGNVIHIDLRSSEVLNEFVPADIPMNIIYAKEKSLLYVSLRSTDIDRIDLTNNTITQIVTSDPVLSMSDGPENLFFTTKNNESSHTFRAESIAHDSEIFDNPTFHGLIGQPFIHYSSPENALFAYENSVEKYQFNADNELIKIEDIGGGRSRDDGSVSLSDDGLFLAASDTSSTSNDRVVHHYSTTNLSLSMGEMSISRSHKAGNYSPSGDLFLSADQNSLLAFSTSSYQKEFEIVYSHCGAYDGGDIKRTQVSQDNLFLVSQLQCDYDAPEMFFIYHELP